MKFFIILTLLTIVAQLAAAQYYNSPLTRPIRPSSYNHNHSLMSRPMFYRRINWYPVSRPVYMQPRRQPVYYRVPVRPINLPRRPLNSTSAFLNSTETYRSANITSSPNMTTATTMTSTTTTPTPVSPLNVTRTNLESSTPSSVATVSSSSTTPATMANPLKLAPVTAAPTAIEMPTSSADASKEMTSVSQPTTPASSIVTTVATVNETPAAISDDLLGTDNGNNNGNNNGNSESAPVASALTSWDFEEDVQ